MSWKTPKQAWQTLSFVLRLGRRFFETHSQTGPSSEIYATYSSLKWGRNFDLKNVYLIFSKKRHTWNTTMYIFFWNFTFEGTRPNGSVQRHQCDLSSSDLASEEIWQHWKKIKWSLSVFCIFEHEDSSLHYVNSPGWLRSEKLSSTTIQALQTDRGPHPQFAPDFKKQKWKTNNTCPCYFGSWRPLFCTFGR